MGTRGPFKRLSSSVVVILSTTVFLAASFVPQASAGAAPFEPHLTPEVSGSATAASYNPFGLMLPRTWKNPIEMVLAFGATSVRPKEILVGNWSGSCPETSNWRGKGVDILLTVRNATRNRLDPPGREVSRPPSNMSSYRNKVESIIRVCQANVLVVENEEDGGVFYEGSASAYSNQLLNACEVARANGIECTNGGMTANQAINMVYVHYWDTGQIVKAESFGQRLMDGDPFYNYLQGPPEQWLREKAATGRVYLDGYVAAGVDYVNFHWYERDAGAFEEVAAFLKEQTGIPSITNETGQGNNDPAIITPRMQKVVAQNMPYAVWHSIDQDIPDAPNVVALQQADEDRLMRPHGLAFQRFIAESLDQPAGHRNISLEIERFSRGNYRAFGSILGDPLCKPSVPVRMQRLSWDERRVVRTWDTTTDAAGNYSIPFTINEGIKMRVIVAATPGCIATSSHIFPLYP